MYLKILQLFFIFILLLSSILFLSVLFEYNFCMLPFCLKHYAPYFRLFSVFLLLVLFLELLMRKFK